MPFGYTASFASERYQILFGKFVKYERIDQNISQNELAKIIGIDTSYLSSVENGKKCPSKLVAESICDALDIDFDFSEETEIDGKETFSLLYRSLHYEGDAREIYEKLMDDRYLYSFAYPYVMLGDILYNVCLIDEHIDRQKIAILSEIAKNEDSSFQVIVSDYELMTLHDLYTHEEVIDRYRETIQEITPKDHDRLLGDLPFAMFYLHAAEYFSDHGAISDAIDATNKTIVLFQDMVYVKGLLAAKGFKAKNYALMKDHISAIREYEDLASNPLFVRDDVIIATCYQNIGSILFEDHQYEKAISYFKRSLDLNSDIKEVICYIALCYYKLNDPKLDGFITEHKDDHDPLVKHVIALISAIRNEGEKIEDLFVWIRDNGPLDITNILAKVLFEHFFNQNMYKEASTYAEILLCDDGHK